MKKRFRARPYRADAGYLFWAIGPDCGRHGKLRAIHLGETAGVCIDRLLKRENVRKIVPAVEIGTGGRGIMHFRKHKKPEYPEH